MDLFIHFILLFVTVAAAICSGLLVFDYWFSHKKLIKAATEMSNDFNEFRKGLLFGGEADIPSVIVRYINSRLKSSLDAQDEINKRALLAFAEKIEELETAHKEWAQTFSDDLQRTAELETENRQYIQGEVEKREEIEERIKDIGINLTTQIQRFNTHWEEFSEHTRDFEIFKKVPRNINLVTEGPLKVEMVPHVVNKLKSHRKKVNTK